MKTPTVNINGNLVEDDDFIPPEPPARTDYAKKALVELIISPHCHFSFDFLGIGRS